jgi:DNA segregation ATPase FtsK/SpoIIIE, S-DNA-T family
MSRLAWTDPAPLEMERPRLPWWTLLPRKLLLATSPIIAVVVAVMVLVFTAVEYGAIPYS